MQHPFLERLEKGPLLADGAMGTQIYAHGIPFERCYDELNLVEPDLILRIHRDYIVAGAELIETNTFGANRYRLATWGLENRVRDINWRAVKIAREAREIEGLPVFLAGSVGPSGRFLAPVGDLSPEAARDAFREQIDGLLEAGADVLVLETFYQLAELLEAVRAARAACDLPIIAQATFGEDGRTLSGEDPAVVARALVDEGVDLVGANCSTGPQGVLDALRIMGGVTQTWLAVMPNAGLPSRIGGRFHYTATPQYFADSTRRFLGAGARIVGGCCGTTPEHVKAIGAALTEVRSTIELTPVTAAAPVPEAPPSSPAIPTIEEQTELAQKLKAGKFVVSVEIDPPRGINPTKMLQGASYLKELGVDCLNISDSAMARVRMGCIASAKLIREQAGLEVIVHYTTRDRSLMGLQSDLIGAHALGIRNILALTGDPPRVGDNPNSSGVWDVDSVGLVRILKLLNEGKDWAGNAIGRRASFFVAAAVNPMAEDYAQELERFRQKLDAGADFVMTQPLYDMDTLCRFLQDVGPIAAPIILGIMPLQSSKHTEFIHNEVPGIRIPDSLRARMREAGPNGVREGIEISREFLRAAQPLVQGIYLMPSFGRYEIVGELSKDFRR